MKNLYEVLGVPDYSTIDEVVKAYDNQKRLFLEIRKPTDEEQAEFDRQSTAFFTLSLDSSKQTYDQNLSAAHSSEPKQKSSANTNIPDTAGITKEHSSNKIFLPVLIAAAVLCSGYYFFSKEKTPDTVNAPQALTEPTTPAEQQQPQEYIEPFLAEFENTGRSLRSSVLYKGLVGGVLHNSTMYPSAAFAQPITATANYVPFPDYSGLIPNTASYNFGDIKLKLENPTDESAYIKVVYLDEDENHVIREVFLQPQSHFVITGLPEGAIQLVTMFPNYPRFAFISYQSEVYPNMENLIPLYGMKVESNTVF